MSNLAPRHHAVRQAYVHGQLTLREAAMLHSHYARMAATPLQLARQRQLAKPVAATGYTCTPDGARAAAGLPAWPTTGVAVPLPDPWPCPECGCPGLRYDGHVCEVYARTAAGQLWQLRKAGRNLRSSLLRAVGTR